MPATEVSAAPIVDTRRSPFARLRPAPVADVTIDDAFWSPRRDVVRSVSLVQQYEQCLATGRIANFHRAAGTGEGEFHGRVYNDSDLYKWLEAAAWALAATSDAELERTVDEVIGAIAAAQRADGYLNTYFTFARAGERWSNFDLHEMYCAGHLIQAAVAHARATGSNRLLDVATRFADHLCEVFGPEDEGKRPGVDGHPEIEMALVELYRVTGQRRYLDQARFFLDLRGTGFLGRPYDRFPPDYHQDHAPFVEQDEVVGHAVRAAYLYAGATDLLIETGDPALRDALHRLWGNMVERKLYLTGGIGARHDGEAFGDDHVLPNARAYAETCAAIGSLMWNWRLLLAEADARYADLIEQTLYNGVLAGLALDGETYFYVNPLASDGRHRRQPWFGTACCPPNIARTLLALPGYLYGLDDRGVWIHLYVEGRANLALADGRMVELAQRTRYPWDGEIEIGVTAVSGPGEFSLRPRIPGWCDGQVRIAVNGETVDGWRAPAGYAEVRRVWVPGDVLTLSLPMAVRRIVAHPHLPEQTGQVALMRGPLVYCLEGVDHPGVELRDLVLPVDTPIEATMRNDLLGGVVALHGVADVMPPDRGWDGRLYRSLADIPLEDAAEQTAFTAIPYYAWANREPGRMLVWLRSRR